MTPFQLETSPIAQSIPKEMLEKLLGRTPLPPLLVREIWDSEISDSLSKMKSGDWPGALPIEPDRADTVISLMFLLNDDLEAAHTLLQALYTPTASYLHGTLHRRDGDFSNALYWFSRVPQHDAFPALQAGISEQNIKARSRELAEFCRAPEWDAGKFVSFCEKASFPDYEDTEALLNIQWLELTAFVAFCF